MKLDILAFGAHSDDVELGCSGTLLKNISLGKKVGIIDLTRGELATRGNVSIRKKEASVAAKLLGATLRENLNMEDGFFEVNKKNILTVIKKIRQYKPTVVLANAFHDRHPDHERAARLISEACFLAGLPKIKTRSPLLTSPIGGGKKSQILPNGEDLGGAWQQAWRPLAVYHYMQYRKHTPDFVVDISDFMEKKMHVIKTFASQFYNPNSKEPETLISRHDFFDYIKKRCEEYGKQIGVKYAEGFIVMEEYRGKVMI